MKASKASQRQYHKSKQIVTTSDNQQLFVRVCSPMIPGADGYFSLSSPNRGKVIVLVHGLTSSCKFWSDFQKLLAIKGYHSVSYDSRGHGNSSKGEAIDYSPARLILDLHEVINAVGAKDAILCGTSYGGLIALGYAAGMVGQPKLSGLILMSTSAAPFNLMSQKPVEPNIGLTKEALESITKGNFAKFSELVFTDSCKRDKNYNKMVKRLAIGSKQANPLAVAQIVKAGASMPAIDLGKSITIPTLIVHGNLDKVFSIHSALGLHRMIPNSQLATIPNRGHEVPLTEAKMVISMIDTFFGNTCKMHY